METIGRKIKRKRLEIELTQEQLAEKVGVATSTICNWENNEEFDPRLSRYMNLVRALGVDPMWLLMERS